MTVLPNETQQQALAVIAATLGETEAEPLRQLDMLAQCLGVAALLALLDEAQQVEAQGGMLTRDGSRRRSIGGVFFHLARSRVSFKDHRLIWPGQALPKPPPGHERPKRAAPLPPPEPMRWDERGPVYQQMLQQPGEARTVKITLIGRPGRVIEQGQCIVTAIKSARPPTLPKGLPTPPSMATTYGVYIARKHWQRVAEAIKNPEDVLIIEGYAAYDPKLEGVAVFATNVTTKLLQGAKRQAERSASPGGDGAS